MTMRESDEILAMVLDSADSFLAERHDKSRLRIGEITPELAVDSANWEQMAELGWLGIGLPEALGGAGLNVYCSAALCERFGRALLPEPFIASALMPAFLLAALPPSPECDRLATNLVDGEMALAIAWQESAGQLGIEEIETSLESGKLNGHKLFVPASLPEMICLVCAVEAGEPLLVSVAMDSPGITMTAMQMGDGSRMVDMVLDDVVPGAVIARGEVVRGALEVALYQAQLALAAQLAGLADGALSLSLEYLRTRVQFGQPIGTFQALQHRAVDLYTRVELAKATWRRAAALYQQAPQGAEAYAAISAAKAISIRAARDTAIAGVQFFGAMGFTEEADIGLYLRTALHWSSWLGNETVHRRNFQKYVYSVEAA